MNKLGLLLCFLLIANISAEESDMVGKIYDIVTNLLKGMSDEGKCAKVFSTKKDQILPIVTELIGEVKNGKSLSELAFSYGLRLLGIEDMATDCKAFALLELFSKITSKEGIKSIGTNISEKADEIYDLATQLKAAKGLEAKVEIAGKILAIVFNFKVY